VVLLVLVIAAFSVLFVIPWHRNVPVGAVLYEWYGYDLSGSCGTAYSASCWTGGLGTSHWNDTAEGIVKDTPDFGDCKAADVNSCYYASDNNDTLAWQFSNMQEAGISVIVVSWWGYGGPGSGTQQVMDEAVNNATLNLFKYLEATQNLWHFRVAIMVDQFPQTELDATEWAQVYDYLGSHFYGPYSHLIFGWQGKPLVLFFNQSPYLDSYTQIPANDTFTEKLEGGVPNQVNWIFWEGGAAYLTSSSGSAVPSDYDGPPVISADGEVGLIWRYDDCALCAVGARNGCMEFDPDGSLGLWNYEESFAVSNAASIKLILLYSWNEYHERTAFEPHTDSTAPNFNGTRDVSELIQGLASAPFLPWPKTTNVFMVADCVLAACLAAMAISVASVRLRRSRNKSRLS
jgi:hypothetical protein